MCRTATRMHRSLIPQRSPPSDPRMLLLNHPHSIRLPLSLHPCPHPPQRRTMATSRSFFIQNMRRLSYRHHRCSPRNSRLPRNNPPHPMWRNIGRRQALITRIFLTPQFPLDYCARIPHRFTIRPCTTLPLILRLFTRMLSALTRSLELSTRASKARLCRAGRATNSFFFFLIGCPQFPPTLVNISSS
jgi:hypothetical protein